MLERGREWKWFIDHLSVENVNLLEPLKLLNIYSFGLVGIVQDVITLMRVKEETR